jgi:OTU domain-containing protein 5
MAGGRRILNRKQDGAELDVRYAYFPPENDPASARGDVVDPSPSASSSSGRVNSTNNPVAQDDQDAREPAVTLSCAHAAGGTHSVDLQQQQQQQDDPFVQALKKTGLEIVEQDGDGNCLFRAISLQVYGDANMHAEVRHRCLDFMVSFPILLYF